jgi:DNA-binding response OmpR family regulator
MKILVVEDDEVTLKALEYRLKLEGFDITAASDGKVGAKLLMEETFDMIVSDILMPHANGLELLNMVRCDMKRSTPFVVMSFLGQSNNTHKAMEIGATDFLEKPIDIDELIGKIKKYKKVVQ